MSNSTYEAPNLDTQAFEELTPVIPTPDYLPEGWSEFDFASSWVSFQMTLDTVFEGANPKIRQQLLRVAEKEVVVNPESIVSLLDSLLDDEGMPKKLPSISAKTLETNQERVLIEDSHDEIEDEFIHSDEENTELVYELAEAPVGFGENSVITVFDQDMLPEISTETPKLSILSALSVISTKLFDVPEPTYGGLPTPQNPKHVELITQAEAYLPAPKRFLGAMGLIKTLGLEEAGSIVVANTAAKRSQLRIEDK